jgi:primosomal protein N' (replication factor Y)
VCGSTGLRSVQVGAVRTAEEFGRAFPEVPIILSSSAGPHGVLDSVEAAPALVVATPGAEPPCPGGYAAAALLDGWLTSAVGGVDASIKALGRWIAAASLVRPARKGGAVILVGNPAPLPSQAFIRWDPAGLAARDLAERRDLGLPPTVRMATITGAPRDLTTFLTHLSLPDGADLLATLPAAEGQARTILRAPLPTGAALAAALHTAKSTWSARPHAPTLRVEMDPPDPA